MRIRDNSYQVRVAIGGIVGDELSRSHLRLLHRHRHVLHRLVHRQVETPLAKTVEQSALGDSTATEEDDLLLLAVDPDNRALNADIAHTTRNDDDKYRHFASIENLNGPIMQIAVNMLGSRRRNVSKLVGRRSRNRKCRLWVIVE